MLGLNLDSACDPTGNVVDCNRGVRCRQVNTDKLLGRLGGLSGDIAEGDRNIEELRRDEAFVVQAVSKPCVHVPDRRCDAEWYRRGGSRQSRCTIWRSSVLLGLWCLKTSTLRVRSRSVLVTLNVASGDWRVAINHVI